METRKDKAKGDAALAVATIADLCADPEITEYQRMHPTLDVVVRKDGTIFGEEPSRNSRRYMRALSHQVEKRLGKEHRGAGVVQYVSSMAVKRWKSKNRAKSSERREKETGESNELVLKVFDDAVQAKGERRVYRH